MGRAWVPEAEKFKTQPSAGKVMTTVCWDAKCDIMFYPKLFTQEMYNNWSVLCKLARPAEYHYP